MYISVPQIKPIGGSQTGQDDNVGLISKSAYV